MKIYLATWLFESLQGEALTKKGNFQRLLSFFHTKQRPVHELRKYVETGKNERGV